MRLLLAATLAALTSCALPTLDASARYLEFEPEGDLVLSQGTTNSGNSIEDLGLAEAEAAAGVALDLSFGMPTLSISSQSSSWEGEGILENEITYDGVTLGIDTPVSSELDLGLHRALLTWDFIPGNSEFAMGVGVVGLEIAGAFEGVVPAMGVQRVEFDETVPIPVVALRLNLDLGGVEVGGSMSGLSANIEDNTATILDLDINGKLHLIGMQQRGGAYLMVGWRQLELDVEVEDGADRVDAALTFSGPYAGVHLSF